LAGKSCLPDLSGAEDRDHRVVVDQARQVREMGFSVDHTVKAYLKISIRLQVFQDRGLWAQCGWFPYRRVGSRRKILLTHLFEHRERHEPH